MLNVRFSMQAYRAWVERNGEEAPLPGVNLTHNQLFFLKYAQVSTLKHEKALGDTQTLRAGCSKVEPNFFAPLQTPFPGAQDGQNLISWSTSSSSGSRSKSNFSWQ